MHVRTSIQPPLAEVMLDDPQRRNAMSTAMFDGLERDLDLLAGRDDIVAVLLHGAGPAFCAGFDLDACADDRDLFGRFILRLSGVNRRLRRLPAVVVAAVQGAAVAGGCALVSACDVVFAAREARFGYPVHRLGVSPAVSMPTLAQSIGPGPARSLLLSGELIDAATAEQLGLVARVFETEAAALEAGRAFCTALAAKGHHALRVTKHWLNELDGSLDDARFDAVARGTVEITRSDEAMAAMRRFRESRPGRSQTP